MLYERAKGGLFGKAPFFCVLISYFHHNACRVRGRNTENIEMNIAEGMAKCQGQWHTLMSFINDEKYIVFNDIGRNRRKKEVRDGVKVIIVLVS